MSVGKDPNIRVLMMGGTIGADFYVDPKNPPRDATFTSGAKKNVENAVRRLNIKNINIMEICSEDSKALIANKRPFLDSLIKVIKESGDKRFLVTCGTDAMREIALEIKKALGWSTDKTVIVTGSMIPLANELLSKEHKSYCRSDGNNNIISSSNYLRNEQIKPGVMINMENEIFNPLVRLKCFSGKAFKELPFEKGGEAVESQRKRLDTRKGMGLPLY